MPDPGRTLEGFACWKMLLKVLYREKNRNNGREELT